MFCIAAFVILSILGIFSVRYRRMAVAAWKCVGRRATLRKCDTSFKEDMKSRLLAKTAVKHPKRVKYYDHGLEVLAFAFVLLMIWSLAISIRSGLNLYVYDTCDPANSESCSLGAEACSIESLQPQFWSSLKHGHMLTWGRSQVDQAGETLSRLPDRIKKWNPSSYTTSTSSYYHAYNSAKPTALEILDPSCNYCAELFKNIEQANVENRYNLTYIAYPIPNPLYAGTYKFQHSYLVASYLEAIKQQPLKGATVSADWQVLQRIFTWRDPVTGAGYQFEINSYGYSNSHIETILQKWLKNIGYTDQQVSSIATASHSQSVKDSLARQADIVKNQIKTVKIPTLLLDTRRYDGVVSAQKLE